MRLKIGLVLVITAVCLVAVLWGLDLSEALAALRAARWGFLLPMCALYLMAHVLRTIVWGC